MPELGIPYENGGPVALGVKGVVVATIDGFGPLCDVATTETMVAQIDDGILGDDSPVVAIVMGIDEIP